MGVQFGLRSTMNCDKKHPVFENQRYDCAAHSAEYAFMPPLRRLETPNGTRNR